MTAIKNHKISTCVSLAFSLVLLGCGSQKTETQEVQSWDEKGLNAAAKVAQGIPAKDETVMQYRRDGKPLFKIELKEPSVVDVATKPEKWGYFQFPNIYRNIDNHIVAKWNMAEDAVTAYGKAEHGIAISKDGGKTWVKDESLSTVGGGLTLANGDQIRVYTPPAIKVEELKLPKAVASSPEAYGRHFSYFKLTELPKQLQGVYLDRLPKGANEWTREHVVLNDPQAARYTDSGMFPVVWWGDMRIAKDGSIVNGIYPGFFVNEKGGIDPSSVFFYKSADQGRTWDILSRIPYVPDLEKDPNGAKRMALGFTEPAFEILSDGTYLCVLRTTDGLGNSPMYVTRSTDEGKSWSKPEAFTPSGVLPRLLQLENGVVVLASGRPGMQLRFSLDGKGATWSDPFEMLPFENEKDAVSCGYPELLETGPDRFLLIYSDFKFKNDAGETRKAIKVREVIVTPENRL